MKAASFKKPKVLKDWKMILGFVMTIKVKMEAVTGH